MKNYVIFGLLVIAIMSCGKNDERLKEKSQIEGNAILELENQNLLQKSESMEDDLTRRHHFYQAIKGNYEGIISTSSGDFNIRITLSPSLPPVSINRVRQLDEITSDLNSLMLNTQIVQWDSRSLK